MPAASKRAVTVRTQSELDALPDTCKYRIRIAGGTRGRPIVVARRFVLRPEAGGDSFVVLRQRAWLKAEESSTVYASGNSQVAACGCARVFAGGKAHVEAHDHSFVRAADRAILRLSGLARALLLGKAAAVARGSTRVIACTQGIVRLEQGAKAWLYRGRRPVVAGYDARVFDRRSYPPLFRKNTED